MTIQITNVVGNMTTVDTKVYVIQLLDKKNNEHEIIAFGLEAISTDISEIKVGRISHHFRAVSDKDIKRPSGKIDLLLGLRYAKIFPRLYSVAKDLVLFKSHFGTGWVLGGYSSDIN